MLWIFIIALTILLICAMTVGVLLEKRHIQELKDKDDKNNYLQRENDYLNEKIAELNLKFSGSLDTREKNYNDIFMKLKKVEIELEKSEMENERLRAKLAVLEETRNEEKEAEKEN